MTELMNCPYCNAKAKPKKYPLNARKYVVKCDNISCYVQPETLAYETPEEAAEIWNRMVVVAKKEKKEGRWI